MRGVRLGRLMAGVLALLLVVACGSTQSGTQSGTPSGERSGARSGELRRPATFAAPEVTWAQGSTLHYGSLTFTVPGAVQQLWRTPYGFLISIKRGSDPDTATEQVFFDGHRTTPLPGEPTHVKISPDGRYAGWIDFRGPRRVLGRLAVAVVTDLRTGEQVFSNHDDMGGPTDDLPDLYEDAGVDFLGFDEGHAYWHTATGEVQRRRAAFGSWDVEPAARPSGGDEHPIGRPHDSLVGTIHTGELDDPVPTREGMTGFRSPSGRWCVTDGEIGRLYVDECRTGDDVAPAFPTRSVAFGGWQGDDVVVVLARRHHRFDGDPATPDRSTGVIIACRLPGGRCHTVQRVRRTESIVFGTGLEPTTG